MLIAKSCELLKKPDLKRVFLAQRIAKRIESFLTYFPKKQWHSLLYKEYKHFYQDFRRRGLDRPYRGSDRRFGLDRRGSHQSNERNSSSNRHRSRSGNSDRVKMPPPKNPPRNIQRRRGGIRPDTKMSLVHKRLAEKHAARGRAREVINKRIKMAKMRR